VSLIADRGQRALPALDAAGDRGGRAVHAQYDSLTAVAEWARRAGQDVLARLGAPYDPFAGRFLAPDEGTLRGAFAGSIRARFPRSGSPDSRT
jgi:hypothetical protein